jgi:hypothetical protein
VIHPPFLPFAARSATPPGGCPFSTRLRASPTPCRNDESAWVARTKRFRPWLAEPELVDLTPAPGPTLAELRKAALPDEPALVHRLIHATRKRGTRGWPLPGSVAPPMGSRRVLAIAALRNPVRGDHGAGVRRSIRRAAAAKLELRARGRTGRDSSLFVRRKDSLDGGARVHPRALLSGYHAPRNSPKIVSTPV